MFSIGVEWIAGINNFKISGLVSNRVRLFIFIKELTEINRSLKMRYHRSCYKDKYILSNQ